MFLAASLEWIRNVKRALTDIVAPRGPIPQGRPRVVCSFTPGRVQLGLYRERQDLGLMGWSERVKRDGKGWLLSGQVGAN